MESSKTGLDLEKELTCSICTELLYQPLTCLDCLHTFCGSCLKEWFRWQALTAAKSTSPPTTSSPYTCPSCRAAVRDTRHNATVATLLDMLLAAHPEKARSASERADLEAKYKPGENIMPKLAFAERTPEQRRLDEAEQRLVDEVRERSLREAVEASAGVAVPGARPSARTSRERDASRSHSREPGRSRESGAEARARETRDRSRRRATAGDEPRGSSGRAEQGGSGLLLPENAYAEERRRHRRQESRQRSADAQARRQQQHVVEHQSSIRSLISSSGHGGLDVEREIEEFARQIQEEGLLDGLDLDNIDLSNNDELSRRITEAYRRRHRERTRHDRERRSNASAQSAQSHRSDGAASSAPADLRSAPVSSEPSRSTSRQRTHSRAASTSSQAEERERERERERGRYPPSSSVTHLDVQEPRRRRRTASRARSATEPASPPQVETRPAARSQTDLALRSSGENSGRPSIDAESRSASLPIGAGASTAAAGTQSLPFRARMTAALGPGPSEVARPATSTTAESEGGSDKIVAPRPSSLIIAPLSANFASSGSGSPKQSSLSSPRMRPQYYHEPSINCSSCNKQHIEYDLHYNCRQCDQGNWNICVTCYRKGKGCHHWFGFGYGAFAAWERAKRASGGKMTEPPHMLTSNRYLRPRNTAGGADGRRTLTTEDPNERLQSGTFCQRCFAWTNECYWRCDFCNEGDWGFCNDCVNQGFCCTHPLLPLAYHPPPPPIPAVAELPTPAPSQQTQTLTPPASPRSNSHPNSRPSTATVATGPNVAAIGGFRPLVFKPPCSICRNPIQPADYRHHCYACTSTPNIEDAHPGDYDICDPCYLRLVTDGTISAENGPGGWRRCPQGHRMVVVAFMDGRDGQRRFVVRDRIGGRRLAFEPLTGHPGLQVCYWFVGSDNDKNNIAHHNTKLERLVTLDVSKTADRSVLSDQPELRARLTDRFPPDGGSGLTATANWAWWRSEEGADDELAFPKGAEITEIEDANGEWFHGVYMGAKGLFPAPYVRLRD